MANKRRQTRTSIRARNRAAVEDPIDGTNEEQDQQRNDRDGDEEAPAANSAAATRTRNSSPIRDEAVRHEMAALIARVSEQDAVIQELRIQLREISTESGSRSER